MQVIDEPVKNHLVERLDDSHVVHGNVQLLMRHGLQLPTRESSKSHGGQPIPVAPFDGFEDIRAVAGARDRQQQVTRRRKVLELFDEDPVVTLVIAPGHDASRVVCKTQHPEPLLVLEVAKGALCEILAEMRRIGP